jgi:glycerol dehydrogenase
MIWCPFCAAEAGKTNFAPNITGDVGSMTACALARLCYDTLLEYEVRAKISCEVHAVMPALEHIVEANTLLSGLGFESGGLCYPRISFSDGQTRGDY